MKILLINPKNPKGSGINLYDGKIASALVNLKIDLKTSYIFPLALPTLAGITPKEHIVKIIDEMIEPIDFNEKCDLVGITAMTYKAERAYEIAQEFRKRGVFVIMGGIHASMCPDEAAKYVDCVVIGEADEIWTKILKDFEGGKIKSRYNMKKYPNITKIPPPRFDLMKHERYYLHPIQTSRGCPFSCKFCTVTKFNGRIIRKKKPEQVIKEIDELPTKKLPTPSIIEKNEKGVKKFNSSIIFFTDDNFAIDREHALSICDALIKYKKERKMFTAWGAQINYGAGLDNELIKKMSMAGCVAVFIGFESLNKEFLKSMNKVMNLPEKYSECISNIRKYGIDVFFSIILGNDFENQKSIKNLKDFIKENKIFHVLPNILTPYPGTELRKEMDNKNRIVIKENKYYNIRNVVFKPKQMTIFELQKAYVNLCKEIFNIERLLKDGRILSKNKGTYFPFIWRINTLAIYTFITMMFILKGKISALNGIKFILNIPFFTITSGNLISLTYLVNIIDYINFAESEEKRFKEYKNFFSSFS